MPSAHVLAKGLLVFFCALVIGCSPESRTKTLKIFFDGVPDSEVQDAQDTASTPKAKPGSTGPAAAAPALAVMSRHPDYQVNRCSRCHDRAAANFLVADKKKICFVCHQEAKFQAEFVHGPVAVGACLSCHHPHESKLEKLLTGAGEDLCLKCHKTEDLAQSEVHQKNRALACGECHDPHAGRNRFFLKTPE
jgi:predicted CXXCH cytochrome family protein